MSSTKLYFAPDFHRQRPSFEFYKDLYEGDQDKLKSSDFLWYHELEKKEQGNIIRKIREQRSSYVNHIETIVSQWTSLVMSSDPNIPDDVAELLGDSIHDIDGAGTSLFSFIRDYVIRNYLLYGRPIIYVGAYGVKPENLKQEIEKKDFRPFWECIHPLNFVDYQKEKANPQRLNDLNFARTEFIEEIPRTSSGEEPLIRTVSKEYAITPEGLLIRRYLLAGKEEQRLFKGRLMQQDQNPYLDERAWQLESEILLSDWDEIPIAAELNGESWLKDIAPHALKYYNTESVLDNIILYQAHQRIFFATADMNGDAIKQAAEYTHSILPEGTQVITVEPTSTLSIETRMSSLLETIYRIAMNQVRIMPSDSKAVQSEMTMREEKEAVRALVKSEMETVENLVNKAIYLYAKYLGKEGQEYGRVEFSNQVGGADIDTFIKLAMTFKEESARLPALKKAQLIKLVHELDLSDKESLIAEIENMQDTRPQAQDPLTQFRSALNEPE